MKKVGVLGGMGPKATNYFGDLILECVNAPRDQDNIDMVISNHASIPDRTDFILGKSNDSPVPYLINDARMLESCGCDFLVLTCNTSHYFYDDIVSNITIPLLNMPKEVCDIINSNDSVKKVGILATSGTLQARVYEKHLKKEIYYPPKEVNDEVMNLIYNKVKKGMSVSKDEFYSVLNSYFDNGCDVVIMGCTELSVIVRDNNLYSDIRIIDSMKVLVDKTIELAKK